MLDSRIYIYIFLLNRLHKIAELKNSLNQFLIFYTTNRRHGGLVKELKIRTPCDAIEEWFKIEPNLFKSTVNVFHVTALNGMVQRGET